MSKRYLLTIQRFRFDSRKYTSLTEPCCSRLLLRERDLVKQVLEFALTKTADEISELTHEETWEAAAEGEAIPLYATLSTGNGEITDDVIAWAKKQVQLTNAAVS